MKRTIFRGMITAVTFAAFVTSTAAQELTAEPGRNNGKGHSGDNVEHPLGKKQSELRKQGLQKVLKGQAQAKGANKVVQVAKGQYRRARTAGRGQDLHDPRPVREHRSTRRTGRHARAAAQPDPATRPQRRQYERSGRRISASRTTRICCSRARRAQSRCATSTSSSPRIGTPSTATSPTGCSCRSTRRITAPTTAAASFALARGSPCGTPPTPGTARRSPPARPRRRSMRTCRSSTSGIATISTGTATSTSRTTTSTTSSSIHAGAGEETGGGAQGTDAIWSHRWYAFQNTVTGPGQTIPGAPTLGGIRIGDSDYWIGDYTVEPEDGGVGVFSHEFGHDLGLPDLYDTSGNVGGAENSTGFWTLYSSGSYGSSGVPADGLGSKPIPMSALREDLPRLVELSGGRRPLSLASPKLGPANANTKQAQQLIVLLPDKQCRLHDRRSVRRELLLLLRRGQRPRQFDDAPGYARVRADHHACVPRRGTRSRPAGTTPTSRSRPMGAPRSADPTSASTDDNQNGQNFGYGITGTSGSPKVCDDLGSPVWIPVTADLSAFANRRSSFASDTGPTGRSRVTASSVDDIAITGSGRSTAPRP